MERSGTQPIRSETQRIGWVSGSYTQPTNGIFHFGKGIEIETGFLNVSYTRLFFAIGIFLDFVQKQMDNTGVSSIKF